MSKFTDYADNDGCNCPYCGSSDMKTDRPVEEFDTENGKHYIYVPCSCYACCASWREIWKMQRIELVHSRIA